MREGVIQLFNVYTIISSEATYKAMKGEGIKILTPKQILQRLYHKSVEQNETLANINRLYNTREDVIQLLNSYTTIAFEARYRALKGEVIKISLP